MALYTIFLEYDEGSYVRQLHARSPQEAVLRWSNIPDILHLFNLEGPGLEPFHDELDADPTAIEGCKSAWCASALVDKKLALITVVKTVNPLFSLTAIAKNVVDHCRALIPTRQNSSPIAVTDDTDSDLPAVPVKVTQWIDYGDTEAFDASVGGWGGWFNAESKGMRWKDFIDKIAPAERRYYEAIRESVIKNKLRLTGSQHQSSGHGTPLFDDDTIGRFTFRAWGDLMAAIWSEEEDKDYSYMDFYC